MLVEVAAMGTSTPGSEEAIDLTWSVLAFALPAVTLVGLLVGAIEILYLEQRFTNQPFYKKVMGKLAVYAAFLMLVISITFPIAASIELDASILAAEVWQKYGRFLTSAAFGSTLLQMCVSLLFCLIYTAISENIGHDVMLNLITGRYHRPRQEERIFMFLDLASSTTIAERLGDARYFAFLRSFYQDLSDGIIDHEAEVYQYIGDEVVLTWKMPKGLRNSNCIRAFFAMKKLLASRAHYYLSEYGVAPIFRAAIHLGKVTTGEIGALKKEIFFTGDVLNVTSRIQGLCKEYQTDFLVSCPLYVALPKHPDFTFVPLGLVDLAGRKDKMEIIQVLKNS